MSAARPAQLLRGAAVALLVVAWALSAHLASAGTTAPDLGAALGVAPLALGALLVARRRGWPALLLGLIACGALLVAIWPQIRGNVAALYLLQHVGTNLALAGLFGGSLLGPGEALITRLARRIHGGHLSPLKIRYTRLSTAVWTTFFVACATLSLLLFWLAPTAVWSVFANLLPAPLVGLMFLAEHLWRCRILPPEERPRFADVVRAWREDSRHRSASARP